MDCSQPGSSVHGILQARILKNGLPFSSPGDLPDPEVEPRSSALQADSSPSEPPGKPPVVVKTTVASNSGTSISTADGPGWEFLWDTNSREQ